jgi:hypothetical protein
MINHNFTHCPICLNKLNPSLKCDAVSFLHEFWFDKKRIVIDRHPFYTTYYFENNCPAISVSSSLISYKIYNPQIDWTNFDIESYFKMISEKIEMHKFYS